MHVNMLAFIGGVPRQIVSDNLKSGITLGLLLRASGQPDLCGPGVARWHGGDPSAHLYKPRDKAKSLPPRRRGSRLAYR